ncbi:MAG: substrate-binding domain-containing protein [Nannocystis sp.]|nr:substrate-binding domain-containing protein [Nannocystis sp.]
MKTERPSAHLAHVAALWAVVLVVAALVILAAAWILAPLNRPPPWSARAAATELADPFAPPADASPDAPLRLAGSGSNLPLTRELAEAFVRRHPARRVLVFESIGSTGGIAAARDRVIDLGLISRPLRPVEDELGLVVLPYARVAVAVAVNLGVADDELRAEELVEIYAGRRRTWRDGQPIIVLQRERGDSGHLAVAAAVPGFEAANDEAYRAARWRVLYNDRAMHEALASTPGAIGLFDVSATQTQALALKLLRVDGVAPVEDSLQAARYPFTKQLAFVSPEAPVGLAAEFIDFVASSDGQAIIRRAGYQPAARRQEAP